MISVIIPIYNEEENIQKLIRQLVDVLKKLSPNYEIIAIDDGSTDNSLKVLKTLIKKISTLRIISFKINQGQTAAIWLALTTLVVKL